jgi:hypothetical protein
MVAHAKLSASGAHRWMSCPGSVAAEGELPNRGSAFAKEGSAAHELAEIVLNKGGSAFDWEGKPLIEHNTVIPDREMVGAVQEYVDYLGNLKGDRLYEVRVDFSPWVPDGFGTSDAIVIDGDTMHVVDLKYGKGVKVDAERNPQAMLYALGAINEFGFIYGAKRIFCHIHQPRIDHVSVWEISVDDLMAWGEEVKILAETALSADAKRSPGEKQCRFCAAKAVCPALLKLTEETIGVELASMADLAAPTRLTGAQLSLVLTHRALINGWMESVEQLVTERLANGDAFPGWKLVEGRSLRQWSDEGEAERLLVAELGDNAHERKLISPAKAEKALGKKRAALVADVVVKPPGKPTLAPESDPRPPFGVVTADDFADLTKS